MDDAPLVEALAQGEAVVYVGAGASAASGLPLWRDFLIEFLKQSNEYLNPEDSNRAKRFLDEGDFLLAAEILQRGMYPTQFEACIDKILKAVPRPGPNDIHRSIARLPFSLAITTNFDNYLDAVYPQKSCYLWTDVDSIFKAIRQKRFAIIKLHGSVDFANSIRLTRTDYRELTKSLELNECLRSLLTWKTFLFIGHSLRDSDLIHLMDDAKLRFGKKFGPHYAILPRHEVEGVFSSSYLKKALSIECIPYEVDPSDPHSHERNIVEILKNLAGKVVKLQHETNSERIGDFTVPRSRAALSVLKDCVQVTGSIRGEVCMIKSDVNPELVREAVFETHGMQDQSLPNLRPDSVIHTAYLQGNTSDREDYIYIKNRLTAEEELRNAGYLNASYLVCDPSVKSELAYPIVADGRRVGVLNLESDLVGAYTADHIEVAGKIAKQLGRIYIQSERRRRTSAPLSDYYRHPKVFEALVNNSRLIRTLNHDFLLYEIDYEKEQLVAHHAGDNEPFHWKFDQPSLAGQVFKERKAIYIANVEAELSMNRVSRKTQLNREGVERFGISGSVFACPIGANGQMEAVLVTWLKPADHPKSKHRPGEKIELWFQSSSGQASRLANLLANDINVPEPSRARSFLDTFYPLLQQIDHGKIWSHKKLSDANFRDQIMNALMRGLLCKACGLRCVRIWQTSRTSHLAHEASYAISPDEGFKCIDSLTADDSTAPGKQVRGAYRGCFASEEDPYCRYTIARYQRDPLARWQHYKMFEKPDTNAANLDKDPNGPWLVAPIVRPSNFGAQSELLGFISADSHDRSSGTPKDCPELDSRVIALQCRIMDLIAELARHVIAMEVRRPPSVGTK